MLQVAGIAQEVMLSHTAPNAPTCEAANDEAALAEQGSASIIPTVISIVKSAASPGRRYRVGLRSPSASGVYIEAPPSKVGDPAALVTWMITLGWAPEESVMSRVEVPAPL
jgi:hypothetical protein